MPLLRDACACDSAESYFEPGRNCWRVEQSDRVAVLVDAAAYFAAVSDAIARAERSVLILSWDIDSRTRLAGGDHTDPERRLGHLLHAALRRRPRLEIRVLNWDFALIYAFERELLARYRRDWRTHPRLHFRFDGHHPLGACHHQKVVVVDDAVAFVGGLDVCDRRWDTPAHTPDDAARIDLAGAPYPPFHDVQIAVDGAAARALGALARERWRVATGERLATPRAPRDPWPARMRPDFRNVGVAIARTHPASETRPAIREVESLFLDMIASARRWLYAENQYLTSNRIADALLARLAEDQGPEIVLVVPREGCGWLEEQTMSMLRKRIVERLRAEDRHGRLRVYAPVVDERVVVNVHSKVMIADDALLRVGSANLSNRSMAVDTECDVAIAATDDRTRAAVAAVRDRLLGDHLGVAPDAVGAALADTGSLIAAIERLRGGRHTLAPLATTSSGWLDALPSEIHVFDPPEPIDAAALLANLVRGELDAPLVRPWVSAAGVAIGFLIGLVLGRRWSTARRRRRHGPLHA